MKNILLYLSYDGTGYSGFQVQENAPTVQGAVERALGIIYKKPVRITGAGRTDAGVHALGQAASYKAPFDIEKEKLPSAINTLLPPAIVVTGAVELDDNFHVRYDARRKIYSYTLDRAPYPQVLKRLYSWHFPEQLDLEMMKNAALLFEGTHDFKLFQASGSRVTDTKRKLYKVQLENREEEMLLILTFEGNGFIYRMARLITGSLVRAGLGKVSLAAIKEALQGKDPSAVGPTAPAAGLCLKKIIYD